jgi:DNA-binding NarL/FixJ family response regulator
MPEVAAMQIKLLVACREEHRAFTLCTQVAGAVDGHIAGDATALAGIPGKAALTKPDVLLLEHALGAEEDTWHALSQLDQVSRHTRALLLCDACTHLMIIGFIQRGVCGCLPRSSGPLLLAKAVRAVARGEPWYERVALLQALQSQVCRSSMATDVEEHRLTPREEEILHLIGRGLSNKEIARDLEISDKTVKTHLHHVYVKLNRSGRVKAFLAQPEARGQPGWTAPK